MPEKAIEIAGETLIARGDGSLYWPARSTLFVADVHFGKAASFRAAAVPVPVGTTASTLDRLGRSLEATGATRLVVLGDLWHAKEGRKEEIIASLSAWRKRFESIEMILVEGNHDRRAGSLPPQLGIREVQEPYLDGPFALCHYPCKIEGAYCLAGHIHPAVSLSAKAKQHMRLPCFWFGASTGVLPAFGDFTGTAYITPEANDTVLVIAESQLHEVRIQAPAQAKQHSRS